MMMKNNWYYRELINREAGYLDLYHCAKNAEEKN